MRRLLGIHDPDGRAAARVRDVWPDGAVHVAPDGACAVGLGVTRRCPLTTATRDDGSFAVVDGATVDADDVLDAWLSGGARSVAELGLDGTVTIWDGRRRTVALVRDPMGVANLYWTMVDGALAWAPDLPSILAVTGPLPTDARTLDAFLADGRVPSPRSWVEGVHKIPPGSFVERAGRGAPAVQRYFALSARPAIVATTDEVVDRFDALLTAAVARRLSSGRTGVLLSAGVDSTLLAAIAARRLDEKVDTFTFRYDGAEGEWNEGALARETADELGLAHDEIAVRPDDLAERFSETVAAFGEPLLYGLHSFMLGSITGIDTLLSGAGADMLYGSGGRPRLGAALSAMPAPVRRTGLAGLDAVRRRSKRVGTRLAAPFTEAWEGKVFTIANPVERARIYRDPSVASAGRHAMHTRVAELRAELKGEPRAAVGTLVWAQIGNEMTSFWNARWARVHDIAIREPFHDTDFLGDILRMPLGPRSDKTESRLLAARMLPSHIAYRPKYFQAIPVAQWFRGPLRDFVRDALAPARIEQAGSFRPSAVTGLVDVHQSGAIDHGWLLLALATITEWQLGVLRRGS